MKKTWKPYEIAQKRKEGKWLLELSLGGLIILAIKCAVEIITIFWLRENLNETSILFRTRESFSILFQLREFLEKASVWLFAIAVFMWAVCTVKAIYILLKCRSEQKKL